MFTKDMHRDVYWNTLCNRAKLEIKFPSTVEFLVIIKKKWHATTKKKWHATTWMNLIDIMLSREGRQKRVPIV